MSDTEMEDGQHPNSSTAAPMLHISDRSCETPSAVQLTLEFLPAFDLRTTEVVLLELFIEGEPTHERLIEGSSPDRTTTFVVPRTWWRAKRRNEPDAREACFHITRGILIRQVSSEPTSLAKIKGNTYKVLYQLTNRNLREDGHTVDSNTAEHSKAGDADQESSQENFYDARSQFKNIPATPTAAEERIVKDLAAAGDDFTAGDSSRTGGRRSVTSSGVGTTASIATIPSEGKVARLDRAKRAIFQDDAPSSMEEPVTAPSPPPGNASSRSVQDPDTEMLDDLAINTEQSENDKIAPFQRELMQTFGTIDGFLSSGKTAAQYGFNNHSMDPDDDAEALVHNRKPLRRTSVAPAGSALHSDISIDSVDTGRIREDSLNGKDDSETEVDETEPAPTSKKHRDPAAAKAARAKWAAAGGLAKTKLRTRVAENDKSIRDGKTPRLWKGKEDFGTDEALNATNIRIEGVIRKQVKLHNLLSACSDAGAASDLRQRLKPWVKGGRIDEYEDQLDAVFSTVQEAPSTDLVASNQQVNDDTAEVSSDDFVLPPLNSQQQKMADFLLSKDQPARKNTGTATHESGESGQQMQPFTSPAMNDRGNEMPEDSDDDELPDPNDFFAPKLPGGNFSRPQHVRNAGKSAERLKKKPRME